MNWQIALLAGAGGYLLGSISFARVIMKIVAPDEKLEGIGISIADTEEKARFSGVGGTAISEKLGPKYGGITALLDIAKTAIPALVLRLAFPGQPYYLIAAAMGIVGHNWPLYHRFKGGRGLSPIYGGFLVTDWIGSLVTCVLGMGLGLIVIKDVNISFLAGMWLMIPWVWVRSGDLAQVAYVVFANVMFILAMIPDIKKIIELKKSGVEYSPSTGGGATAMGRMIKKMANRMGLLKDKAEK